MVTEYENIARIEGGGVAVVRFNGTEYVVSVGLEGDEDGELEPVGHYPSLRQATAALADIVGNSVVVDRNDVEDYAAIL